MYFRRFFEPSVIDNDTISPIMSINDFVYAPNIISYNKMANELDIILAIIKINIPSARLLFCDAAGHTVYDSNSGSDNKFQNIDKLSIVDGKLEYVINEPHMLRSYIQESMNSELGRSNQELQSKTTGVLRHYHCGRVGSMSSPVGVLAFSYQL
jgi:hypothetical protein